jgi:cob(I)alamin adenosyltransferase
MLLVITGNGKGKTTSAIGDAIRAAGWKKKVGIVFFDKGGDHYGEQKILDLLKKHIKVLRFGRPRFDEVTQTFDYKKDVDDVTEARNALKAAKKLIKQQYFLVVCDEILNCIELGFITITEVQSLIYRLPKKVFVILTGRTAPKSILKKADLISEVKEVKHYFRIKGETIKGIDY